jgi:hypothetical protein
LQYHDVPNLSTCSSPRYRRRYPPVPRCRS